MVAGRRFGTLGRRCLAVAVAVIVLGAAGRASALTCTWTGGSSSSYSGTGNWSSCRGTGTSAPNATDTAQFSGTPTRACLITSSTTVGALTVTSTYTSTVTASAALVVTGALQIAARTLTASTTLQAGSVSLTGGNLTLTGTSSTSVTVTGAVSITSGTLSAGAVGLQAGSVSLSGGNFTLSSSTTTVDGAFSNSGGSFNANGGTVTLTGSGSLTPGTSSFNNLTINSSGNTYTLGSALLVGNDLTITAGTLAMGSWSVGVSGNWSNSGSFTGSNTVTLSETGSGGTLKSGGSSFAALIINGSGGTYTMQDALSVTGALTLTAGTLATSTFNLSVGGALTISGGAFIGGSGTVGITGNLTLTGGSYTGGAGTATIGGNVSTTNTVIGSDPTLVGYWPLDETASPSVDSSGNGTSLTWSGTPVATTSVPSSISFTDSHSLSMTGTQYAMSADLSGISVLTPSTITISAWYKATAVDTSGAELVSGSNTYGLRLTSTGAMVMKRISDNTSAADWIEYRVPLTGHLDGAWHQITGEIVTGTGGGMTLYIDGVVGSGNYWVNGSSGASQLSGSTTPTAATAATTAIDWDANTETFGLTIGTNPSTTGYQFGKNCTGTNCAIDDVRVYSRALTGAEIAALSHGNQPSGSTGVITLTGAMTVTGSVTVQSTATLTLNSGSTLSVGTALTMDGTLNATSATITKSLTSRYAFKVGSSAAAAPVLNINGLAVSGMDTNGMWINANTGAVTTFTRFDSLAFSNGTGTQLLQIYAKSLFLSSNGCTFDSSATYAVTLTGNGTGSGAGPRVLFGNATCGTNDPVTGLCANSQKFDDDRNDNNGVADNPSTNGAVVQFVRGAESDTDGTLIGFPTSAFNWNDFSYYSTYAAFHNAAGGADVIYVRDPAGNALYSWTDPTADEAIVGTPQWTTVGTTHYLYVAVNGGTSTSGKVYRLIDTGTQTTSGSLTVDTTWATSGAYACTCTITSNVGIDSTNLYWAATTSTSTKQLMGLVQSTGLKISTSWPVTTPADVTTSAPMLWNTGTTKLYLGVTASVLQLAVTGTTFVQNSKLTGTVTGRVTGGTSALAGGTFNVSRVYAGDSTGTMLAISPTSFSGTSFLWSYAAGAAITDNSYDSNTDSLQFGTSGGKVVVLNAGTGAVLNASYPYTLGTSDPITAAPLYVSGILAVGTTKGKLYLMDRNTGTGASVIQTYSFGSSYSVSTVAYDPNVSRIMVSTSSPASDGRIYYLDLVSDPTPSSL